MQGDLEQSLEKLNKHNEFDWWECLDEDVNHRVHVGEKFFKYKQELVMFEATVKKHFNRTMVNIQEGLPEVPDEEEDETDFTFGGTDVGEWTCRICTSKNEMKVEKCI